MRKENVQFYSDGLKLQGSFYYPDSQTSLRNNIIIPCSGFLGLKNIHPERFARYLTKEGYICFGFDYRGFANSEGTRGRVCLEEQIRDIVEAVSFVNTATSQDRQAPNLVLLGWGMGAGLILEAARLIPQLKSLICINGFYNAPRTQKQVRSSEDWAKFLSWLEDTRVSDSESVQVREVDPFVIYPLDPVTKNYVDSELRKNPDFGVKMQALVFADSLLRFCPEDKVHALTHTPVLIAHGEDNRLHPTIEAQSLYQKYPGPKELYWIPKAGHTEWMYDNHPTFIDLMTKIGIWLDQLS